MIMENEINNKIQDGYIEENNNINDSNNDNEKKIEDLLHPKESESLIKYDGLSSLKLAIIDDYFPNIKTGFRVAEYNYYINYFKQVSIYCENPNFSSYYSEYSKYYPENCKHIFALNAVNIEDLKDFDVFYTVFINNAFRYLKYFEYAQKPFIFTLYPGGGFQLGDSVSDNKLRAVFSSKYFTKVIVTQKVTYEYLISNNFLEENKIEFIYGSVTNKPLYSMDKKLYKRDKKTFDICFVAAKYMKNGLDKGYDFFIEVCKKLCKFNDVRFHVVGGFDSSEFDVSALGDTIKFYGMKNIDFFPEFYSNMDIILSPNRPYKLFNGAFDGFPTGCCVDAALNGTAIFCTDLLNLNISFVNEEDMVIINLDVDEVVKKILHYKENLDDLYKISKRGKKKFCELYDLNNQMKKRVELIEFVQASGLKKK